MVEPWQIVYMTKSKLYRGKSHVSSTVKKTVVKSKSSTSARICAQSRRRIFCSPMQERWKSRNLQSADYAELNGNPDYQRYIDSGGTTAFPGGETKAEFTDRVMRGFEKVFVDVESREEQKRLRCDVSLRIETAHTSLSDTIIIVAHGGTIMALMDQLSEPHKDYFDWQVKPGEGIAGWLEVTADGMQIVSYEKMKLPHGMKNGA